MTSDLAFYTTRLERLKRDGAALLVTGAVPVAAQRAAVRTLLGAPGESRRRVLALADPAVGDPADLLPADAHPADDRVRVVARTDLDALHLGVSKAMAAVRPDDPDGGQVRLSVAALPPLLEAHESAAVRRFVRSTAAQVRGVRGMAHYLLPGHDDAKRVRRLRDAVDARVELREPPGGDGPPEHCWHLPDRDDPSPWRDLPVTADHGWAAH